MRDRVSVEPGEIADEMIERVLNPFIEHLTHCQRLGMPLEGMYLCMAILQGLYEFQQQSKSQFKDWATDLPIAYAEIALEKWQVTRGHAPRDSTGFMRDRVSEGKPTGSARKKLRNFMEENLPGWESTLVRLLATGAER